MKTWHTRQGEPVTVGDTVALSVLGHRGAKGVIVGELDGDVEVRLTTCETCSAGVNVRVLEDGLVWLLAYGTTGVPVNLRGGELPGVR